MADQHADETTVLLGARSPSPEPPSRRLSSALRRILAIGAVTVLVEIASQLSTVPQTEILEKIVCRNYYARDGLHDVIAFGPDRCKAEPVQSELAYVRGWQFSIQIIPNIILAVPYGALADRIGRKKVLLLSLLGIFMNDNWMRLVLWFPDFFPVRAVLFSGAWQIIGAGAATLSALTYLIVADACSPEQRLTAFSAIRSARYLTMLIFAPLGGILSKRNPWIPMFLSTAFTVAGLLVAIMFVQETLMSATRDADTGESDSLLSESSNNEGPKAPYNILGQLRSQVLKISHWTAENWRVVPLVVTFFTFMMGEEANETLLLQYASKRLGWSFGKVSYLISLRAAINVVVLTVVIPAISAFLTQRLNFSAMHKDKRIAQGNALFLVLGAATFSLASSPALMVTGQALTSLGDAFAIPLRSLVTGMVEQEHRGTLYMVIQVWVEGALFAGGPLMASAFKWGMQLGSLWIGLPFLIATGFFALALAAVSSVNRRVRA